MLTDHEIYYKSEFEDLSKITLINIRAEDAGYYKRTTRDLLDHIRVYDLIHNYLSLKADRQKCSAETKSLIDPKLNEIIHELEQFEVVPVNEMEDLYQHYDSCKISKQRKSEEK